jgi:hypothetical protein
MRPLDDHVDDWHITYVGSMLQLTAGRNSKHESLEEMASKERKETEENDLVPLP